MTIGSNKEPLILFLGDFAVFTFAFWVALAIRGGEVPSTALISLYAIPFLILSILWFFVFFIVGLYDRHALVFRQKLPGMILNAQIANSLVAIVFFYLFSFYFHIAPKTILALYLVTSSIFVMLWRLFGGTLAGVRRQEHAILMGSGDEMRALREEVNERGHYNLTLVSSVSLDHIEGIDFQNEIVKRIYSEQISSIVIDLRNNKAETILPSLYNLIFSRVRFLDMNKVYEEVFERIPLSMVKYNWFLENISSSSHVGYGLLKRLMDIILAVFLGIFFLPLYPFVALAIKLDDQGPVFIVQDRVGRNNIIIKIVKFRSMAVDATGKLAVTRAGKFLRMSRIDELPQLWNVIWGELSLVGPRPELPDLVKVYEREIPYYNVRHLATPGLSGWGQVKDYNVPRGTADVDKTRIKLSYDLYYIKNRSFILDVIIALRTIRTLLSRSGN
jgi:exopolysaccharide biosynthesis polyprenyl glycosylphosphotransferase